MKNSPAFICTLVLCFLSPILVTTMWEVKTAMKAQAEALEQIADSLKRSSEQNECHETLQLFDEMLRHDIRHGGR